MVDKRKGKAPVYLEQVGGFQVSVFLNKVEKNGRELELASSNLQKSWTKDGKNWEKQTINFFNPQEVDKAIVVLQHLKEKLYKKDWSSGDNED